MIQFNVIYKPTSTNHESELQNEIDFCENIQSFCIEMEFEKFSETVTTVLLLLYSNGKSHTGRVRSLLTEGQFIQDFEQVANEYLIYEDIEFDTKSILTKLEKWYEAIFN